MAPSRRPGPIGTPTNRPTGGRRALAMHRPGPVGGRLRTRFPTLEVFAERRFMQARLEGDEDAMAAACIGPQDALAVRRNPDEAVPWRIAIGHHHVEEDRCTVQATYDVGRACADAWRFALSRVDGVWRIDEIEPGAWHSASSGRRR